MDGESKNAEEKTPFNQENDEHFDPTKAKYINGGANADVEIYIPEKKKNEFCGLTKEELLEYANDPFWVKTRWVLLILFWVAWILMLVAAIVIIVFAPKCPPRPKLEWHEKTAVYQIYPRSFKDSDGDGNGDLDGIQEKLDYLTSLNVSTVWLNSIYAATDFDWGYDVTDHIAIHEDFGSMEDFENLRIAMHKKGMRLILDFIPNHTSKNHTWFQESRQSSDNPFADYYVWVEGDSSTPPNNWLSLFGGPAWTFDDVRQAWYYHTYLPEQPDLNLRSERVKEELKEILTFWLDKKVDGFRVDAAPYLFEAEDLADELTVGSDTTTFLPQSYEIVTEWRQLLDAYSKVEGLKHPRLLVVEAQSDDVNKTNGFYEYNGRKGAHMQLNFNLMDIDSNCNARCVNNKIRMWLDNLPDGKWSNWRTGNHEHSRMASRFGPNGRDAINVMTMLSMTLPGTQITYYGEELGMVDVPLTFEQTRDTVALRAGEANYASVSRDPERTPMQWSGEANSGFSTAAQTWLPVANDYNVWNVKAQTAHGSALNNLEVYRDLTVLRKEPSMMWGKMHEVLVDDNILAYVRKAQGFKTYLVILHLGTEDVTLDLRTDPDLVPAEGVIVATTKNFDGARASDFEEGVVATLDNIKLRPKEGVVIGWEWF